LAHFNIKYFANFLEIIFKHIKVNYILIAYNLMTKILLFKHAYNFVFVFVQNFKQFTFWEFINKYEHKII